MKKKWGKILLKNTSLVEKYRVFDYGPKYFDYNYLPFDRKMLNKLTLMYPLSWEIYYLNIMNLEYIDNISKNSSVLLRVLRMEDDYYYVRLIYEALKVEDDEEWDYKLDQDIELLRFLKILFS